nr:Z1 domain-containing protein [Microbacterium sp. NC79]
MVTPTQKTLASFVPELAPSLEEAVRWFLLATAIRELRTGTAAHSSMLLHTTHRVLGHERLKEMMSGFVNYLAGERQSEEQNFREVFLRETKGIGAVEGLELPEWHEVWARAYDLIGKIKVVVDNGYSTDRLSYPDDTPQLIIAIGGGTLSRGLTLEGLVVSYFLRTSNTYDTLLQMGRWFGFRPYYQDLARVWASSGLLNDYRHLAIVEEELRADVVTMEKEGRVPREYALRVRAHPGRLSIVAPGKMWATKAVNVGLGGTRHQRTILDKSRVGALAGQTAARDFVARARETATHTVRRSSAPGDAMVFSSVPTSEVVTFLDAMSNEADGSWLRGDAVKSWAATHRPDARWNVVLAAGKSGAGTFAFDEETSVRLVNRAPLSETATGGWRATPELTDSVSETAELVNIRALMSGSDWVLDLEILAVNNLLDPDLAAGLKKLDKNKSRETHVKPFRKEMCPEVGVVVLYAIDRASQPAGTASAARVAMNADEDLIGVGIVYPWSLKSNDHNYFAVDLNPAPDLELDEELPDQGEDGLVRFIDDEDDFKEGQ